MLDYSKWEKLINEYSEISLLLNKEIDSRLKIMKWALKSSNIQSFESDGFIFKNDEFFYKDGSNIKPLRSGIIGLDGKIIKLEETIYNLIKSKTNSLWTIYNNLCKKTSMLDTKGKKVNKKI